GFAAIAGWVAVSASRPMPSRLPPTGASFRVVAVAAGLVAALLASFGQFAWPTPRPKVLILNQGGFDWQRPRPGHYGLLQGGMFGLLPQTLRPQEIQVDALPVGPVTAAALAGADVFVLVNCARAWSVEERRVVHEFLQRGGSLLVLG